MNNISPLLLLDSYKAKHHLFWPEGTSYVYSNMTARKSRIKGCNEVVVFGLQYFIKNILIERFNNDFFNLPLEQVIEDYKRVIDYHLGEDLIGLEKVKQLHKLGYLPLIIKSVPEGELCPIGVPILTVANTHPDFSWLTNYIETVLSTATWQCITSATIARLYRKLLNKYAMETVGNTDHVQWQAHDFSMRGLSSVETAMCSGGAHLTSFTGSDTIPAIWWLEKYYNANCEQEVVSCSISASEHAVMCAGTREGERETYRRLIEDVFPNGLLALVSDTYDLFGCITTILPSLKDSIMKRDGKVIIRPDSGDPVEIICGEEIPDLTNECETLDDCSYWMQDLILDEVREETPHGECGIDDVVKLFRFKDEFYQIHLLIDWNRYEKRFYYIDGSQIEGVVKVVPTPEQLGVVELLWNLFGGTTNKLGYKELDSHIGTVYGDSITLERADEICKRLKDKGFASNNITFGVGSFTYQYNTRDTFSLAIKATMCVVNGEERAIFKDPATDKDKMKKSARGLLQVYRENDTLKVKDGCTREEEAATLLEPVFEDGRLLRDHTLAEIRERVKATV